MTHKETAAKIINLWRIEHTPEAIMMTLIMLGAPLTRAQILSVIRTYCDVCTENMTYISRKKPPISP